MICSQFARTILVFTALFLTFGGPSQAKAETPEPTSQIEKDQDRAQQSRDFANHLFKKGEYYRAIGEYQRYLFLNPKAPDSELMQLRSGLAYLFGGEYQLANHELAQLGRSLKNPEYARMADFGRSQASFLDGSWKAASVHLKTFTEKHSSPNTSATTRSRAFSHHALLMLGWTHIRLDELEEAEKAFAKLAKISPPERGYEKLAQEIYILRKTPQGKSPSLAGFLSIIPGLGHAYIERPELAIFSLAWNSLFIYAAADNIVQENYGTGSILSAFALLWYSGTIYGAVNGAHKWNRDMKLNKLEELESDYPADPGLKLLRSEALRAPGSD